MKTQSMDERGRSTLGMVNEIGYCYPREARHSKHKSNQHLNIRWGYELCMMLYLIYIMIRSLKFTSHYGCWINVFIGVQSKCMAPWGKAGIVTAKH